MIISNSSSCLPVTDDAAEEQPDRVRDQEGGVEDAEEDLGLTHHVEERIFVGHLGEAWRWNENRLTVILHGVR